MEIKIELSTSFVRDTLNALKDTMRRDEATEKSVRRKRSLSPVERAMWLADLTRRRETFRVLHGAILEGVPPEVRKFL